ncbi:MAG: hypothetical protein J0I69_03280 [Altererythrobacter sp.]|nr:hypothetical protein [Altererythrobacter sp.]OJU61019.1 MAG: hypothetical protein BGO08_13000 [Altererythrobacter sp. 66-12]
MTDPTVRERALAISRKASALEAEAKVALPRHGELWDNVFGQVQRAVVDIINRAERRGSQNVEGYPTGNRRPPMKITQRFKSERNTP